MPAIHQHVQSCSRAGRHRRRHPRRITALDALLGCLGYTPMAPPARLPPGVWATVIAADSPAVVERVADIVEAGPPWCLITSSSCAGAQGQRLVLAGGVYRHRQRQVQGIARPTASGGTSCAGSTRRSRWSADLRWSTPAGTTTRSGGSTCRHPGLAPQRRTEMIGAAICMNSAPASSPNGRPVGGPRVEMPLLPGLAAINSCSSPARSGSHQQAERPAPTRYIAGKWRMSDRVAWWDEYDDAPAVVFGHYWRWPLSGESPRVARPCCWRHRRSNGWVRGRMRCASTMRGHAVEGALEGEAFRGQAGGAAVAFGRSCWIVGPRISRITAFIMDRWAADTAKWHDDCVLRTRRRCAAASRGRMGSMGQAETVNHQEFRHERVLIWFVPRCSPATDWMSSPLPPCSHSPN